MALVSWPFLQTYLLKLVGYFQILWAMLIVIISPKKTEQVKREIYRKGKKVEMLFFFLLFFSKTHYIHPPLPIPTSPPLNMPLQAAPLLPHLEEMTCVALSTVRGKMCTARPARRHYEREQQRAGMTLAIVDQALGPDKCPAWDPDLAATAQDHQPLFGSFRR